MTSQPAFRLQVRQVERSCVFDLFSRDGQQISATIRWSEKLSDLYQNWKQIYGRRYALQSRAKVGYQGGSGTPRSYDWDQELQIAETALLKEFDYWLGQAELLEIRETIQRRVDRTSTQRSRKTKGQSNQIDLLLECSPIDLARLPWESWKLLPKNTENSIRIARTCTTQVVPPTSIKPYQRSKIRVLAILADAPELNHERDQRALRSLQSIADIQFIHCREILESTTSGSQISTLKQQIAAAIEDPDGWDVLFFAGHSDETTMTGGKLELASQITLSISEIESQLLVAKQRGLQLAIFNSCCGLSIAESLIRLGLPQIVVMRERIQDAVAHKFLEQFCQSLSQYQDVHTAVLAATRYFAAENISYPSAYLIPSLYRHPDPKAPLFQVEQPSPKRFWQRWKPTRWEAIAVGTLSFLSLVMPLQELLFEARYWSQAAYRQITNQLSPPTVPPVTLLKIDQASIDRAKIDAYRINPMSRAYLAQLVDRLRQLNVPVVGIDYLLDGSTKEDPALANAIRRAVEQQTWFVLAMRQNDVGQPIQPNSGILKPGWILQGNIDVAGWDVMLPQSLDCRSNCPFAYQLALAKLLNVRQDSPRPNIDSASNLQQQVYQYLQSFNKPETTLTALKETNFPFKLQPVTDLSLPPDRVYQSIAAWDFLERPLDDPMLRDLKQQVVIIGSGGYDQADDNFPLPLSIQYWRSTKGQLVADELRRQSKVLPGVTVHAYNLNHLLSQHLLLPIPTLWILGMVIVLGKVTARTIATSSHEQQRRWVLFLVGGTIVYGFVCLQGYITVAIIFPWLFPTTLFWLYVLPTLRQT